MQDQIFSLKIDGVFCQIGLEDLKDLNSCAEKFLKQNNLDICFKDKLVQRFQSFFEMFIENDQDKIDKTQKKFYNNQINQVFDDETEKQIIEINQNYYKTLKESDKVFERLYKDSERRKRKKLKLKQFKVNIKNDECKETNTLQQKNQEQTNDILKPQKKQKQSRFDELYQDALNQRVRLKQKQDQQKPIKKIFINKNSEKILQDSSIPRNFYHRVLYQKNMRQRSLKKIKMNTQCSFYPKTNKSKRPQSQDNIPHYQKLFQQSQKPQQKIVKQNKKFMSLNSRSIIDIKVKAIANQYFQNFKDSFTEVIKVEQIELKQIPSRQLQILTPLLLDMNQFNHDITKQQFECLFKQFYQQLNLFDKQILQRKTEIQKSLTQFLFTPKLNPKSLRMAKNRKFQNLFSNPKN